MSMGTTQKRVDVIIKGISPLLMNRPDLMDIDEKSKRRLAGVDKSKEDFEKKKYLNDEGLLFTPDTHLKGALIESGKKAKVKGQGKATYSKIIGYAVLVSPSQIVHQSQDVEPYTVLAVNPNTKGRNALTRPMLKEWELSFQIEYDSEEIPAEVLKECLDNAGRRVGIGDWRPQKKGTFGRFMVTKFEEAK